MIPDTKIDPDTIGQMVAEGIAIINEHADAADGQELERWLADEAKTGNALRPLQQLTPIARELLDDASIINDTEKQMRVAVAHDALSGLLSLYGIEA